MRIANEGAESWLFISAVYVSIHLQSTKPKKDNNNNNVYFTFVRTYLLYITSVLVRSFTLLVDRELVNHNWEEGVWLCVCNICNDI